MFSRLPCTEIDYPRVTCGDDERKKKSRVFSSQAMARRSKALARRGKQGTGAVQRGRRTYEKSTMQKPLTRWLIASPPRVHSASQRVVSKASKSQPIPETNTKSFLVPLARHRSPLILDAALRESESYFFLFFSSLLFGSIGLALVLHVVFLLLLLLFFSISTSFIQLDLYDTISWIYGGVDEMVLTHGGRKLGEKEKSLGNPLFIFLSLACTCLPTYTYLG